MYECYEEGLDGYAYKIYTSRFMAGQKIKIDGEMKEQMFTKNTRAFIWDGNRYDIPSDLSIVDLLPSNASEILTIEVNSGLIKFRLGYLHSKWLEESVNQTKTESRHF